MEEDEEDYVDFSELIIKSTPVSERIITVNIVSITDYKPTIKLEDVDLLE